MAAPTPSADDTRDTLAFEALMWSMARPGLVSQLPNGLRDLVLAMVDRECRVMLDDPLLAPLVLATGATFVQAGQADHAFCLHPETGLAALHSLPAGSALYPDEGATLVICARIGEGQALRLSGPGIEGTTTLRIGGLAPGFFDLRAERCRYPEGIELVFVDDRQLVAIPRSTRIEVL